MGAPKEGPGKIAVAKAVIRKGKKGCLFVSIGFRGAFHAISARLDPIARMNSRGHSSTKIGRDNGPSQHRTKAGTHSASRVHTDSRCPAQDPKRCEESSASGLAPAIITKAHCAFAKTSGGKPAGQWQSRTANSLWPHQFLWQNRSFCNHFIEVDCQFGSGPGGCPLTVGEQKGSDSWSRGQTDEIHNLP
jgi:hypothetical protein